MLTDLVFQPGDDVAGRGGRHQKGRNAFLARGLVGDGENDGDIAFLAGGDELLDTVQHPFVAFASRRGGDGAGVGADVRFGQAEAAEFFTTRQRLEPFLAQCIAAVFEQNHAGQRVLDADDGRRGAIGGGDFFNGKAEFDVAKAGAVPFFGHHHAKYAEFGQTLQRLAREGAVLVPLGGEGGDLFLREGAHRVADHFLFLRQNHVLFSF